MEYFSQLICDCQSGIIEKVCPMTKKTRKTLFFICLVLFLLLAPIIVLYSQGYRIDFDAKKLTQTGGLYLKTLPKQVEVYLDDKLKEKTDFFFGSILIENLLPKEYKIEVKKTGFHSWQKTLSVKEKEVAEAKSIILLPENVNFQTLTQKTEEFWFSPDEKKIVLFEGDSVVEEETETWSLKLYDLDKKLKSHLIEEKDISKLEADLINLTFSGNSTLFLEIGTAEQTKYFSLEIDKAPPILKEVEAPLLLLENEIYKEKIPEDAMGFKISPDEKKVVYFTDYEIWILYLEEQTHQPRKEAGEKTFLVRLSEKIGDAFWMNSDYLVFNSGDKIKITEADERDGLNIIDIKEIKNPQMFWSENEKKLYILSENSLFCSSALLP